MEHEVSQRRSTERCDALSTLVLESTRLLQRVLAHAKHVASLQSAHSDRSDYGAASLNHAIASASRFLNACEDSTRAAVEASWPCIILQCKVKSVKEDVAELSETYAARVIGDMLRSIVDTATKASGTDAYNPVQVEAQEACVALVKSLDFNKSPAVQWRHDAGTCWTYIPLTPTSGTGERGLSMLVQRAAHAVNIPLHVRFGAHFTGEIAAGLCPPPTS